MSQPANPAWDAAFAREVMRDDTPRPRRRQPGPVVDERAAKVRADGEQLQARIRDEYERIVRSGR